MIRADDFGSGGFDGFDSVGGNYVSELLAIA